MREIINLDLQKSQSAFSNPVVLRARRGDSRSLTRTFQIFDNGQPLDLTGLTVTFMANNAGGHVIMEPIQSQDASGQFEYTLPSAVAAVEGLVTMAYFRVESTAAESEWVGSTDQIRIEVLGDVSLTDDVTGDYVPLLDQILEASEELSENAGVITAEATDAINSCNQATETANSAAQNANEQSVVAKDAAEACDASRLAIEANEATRQNNEVSRKSYETQRRNAETAREDAETARALAEAKRVADFADMEQRSRGWLKYYCGEGEYDATTRMPVIASPDSGTLYCTPVENPTANNHWTEWEWDYPNQRWELHGTTEDAVVAITADEIDEVIGGQSLTGSQILNLTDLVYLLAQLDRRFAELSHEHPVADITGTLPVSKGGTGVGSAPAERNRLGLGNTTGPVPLSCGGTGVEVDGFPELLLAIGAAAESEREADKQVACGCYRGRRIEDIPVLVDELQDYANAHEFLGNRVKNVDFKGLRPGDTFPAAVLDNTRARILGFDHYYNCSDQPMKHHIACEFADPFTTYGSYANANGTYICWNQSNTSCGDANGETNPYLNSYEKKWENALVVPAIPSSLKSLLLDHRSLVEVKTGTSAAATGWKWANLGITFLLSEMEVYGTNVHGTPRWSVGQDSQFPWYAMGTKNRIFSGRVRRWLRTASGFSASDVCSVSSAGDAGCGAATYAWIRSLLGFLLGPKE